MNNIFVEASCLLSLLTHVLKVTAPVTQPPENLDWNNIYYLSKAHSITNAVFYALKKQNINQLPVDIAMKFSNEHEKEVFKEAQQEVESNQIIAKLTENKIRCMPLKGFILKNLYAKPDIRSMTDIDMLVDADKLDQIKEIMLQLGFTLDHVYDNHDVYFKPPFMTVEFHRALIAQNPDMGIYEYFGSWDRSKLKTGSEYVYELTNEDYYIYMIGHMAKHFYSGGCGIRSVMDIWVYLDYYKNSLDFVYIKTELEKCNLLKFSHHMERLSGIWFNGEESSDFYILLTKFIVKSGTYGTANNSTAHNIITNENTYNRNNSNFKRIMLVIFPSINQIYKLYPILKRLPILLPFCWIHRILKILFYRRKNIRKRFNDVYVNKNSLEALKNIYSELGLKTGG